MARKAAKAVARGGRPSRADALRLRDRILAAATELFLAEGYGSTSIEAVAARAGISKRTFYDRFDDKAQLFAAVVHRIIEQIRPPPEVPLVAGATLPDDLAPTRGIHAARSGYPAGDCAVPAGHRGSGAISRTGARGRR